MIGSSVDDSHPHLHHWNHPSRQQQAVDAALAGRRVGLSRPEVQPAHPRIDIPWLTTIPRRWTRFARPPSLRPGWGLAPEPDAGGLTGLRMERRKEVQQPGVGDGSATEQGLVLGVHRRWQGQDNGSPLGLVLRTLGHASGVAVVPVLKGRLAAGRAKPLESSAMPWLAVAGKLHLGTQNATGTGQFSSRRPRQQSLLIWPMANASWWCSMKSNVA